MGRLFGTDGVRGIAGEDLDASLALKIGKAAAYVLGKDKEITVLVGRDTRISGQMLASALSAGLMSFGAKVIDLGVVPTPAVSYLVQKYGATMGAMISASHNPSEYNGIKLFDGNGFKLPDKTEEEIEKYILDEEVPLSNKIGTLEISKKAIDDYTDYLVSTVGSINKDLKIVIDCACGSASATAPLLFKKLGLKPTIIHKNYDGNNINDKCGSTHLESLIKKVKSSKADIGIAYDGDADRCLLIDHEGNEVDGDFVLAIEGLYLKKHNELDGNAIVGTVMSNLGLRKFCEANDIKFIATKVGDRYVLENMLENGYVIGGEQSGHIIFKKHANTGDGELTSIQILDLLTKESKSIKEASKIMNKYPQVLANAHTTKEGKEKYASDKEIQDLIKEAEDRLAGDGRILIRPSGTENLIRVMIEGNNIIEITKDAENIARLIEEKYSN